MWSPAVAFVFGKPAHLGMEQEVGVACGKLEIAICKAFCQNLVREASVELPAFGLPVTLIPAEIQPFQTVEDRIERSLGVAFDVGVVNPQDHSALIVPGVQPIENEGPRAADVEITSGRGGKADSGHGNFRITVRDCRAKSATKSDRDDSRFVSFRISS